MDRISNLPDFLLCHVHSFLPTKLAASTSVLSKRWQFLWIMVHNLDLEFEPHIVPKDHEGPAIVSFVNFVNKFFTERDKDLSIKRFRLNLLSTSSKIHVDSWVLAAISSHVEVLDLDLSILECLQFCCSRFTCKTLVVLKLSHGIVIHASPSSIHFPSLKVLELWWIYFENHDTFNNLISGCPVLENLLLLKRREFEESSAYMVSSPTLRKLAVYLTSIATSTQLCVEAPSLENLNLEIHRYDDIYLNNLGSLVEADVNLQIDDIDDVDTSPIVQDVLEALYNVQVLILDRSTLKGIDYGVNFECLPIFHNLVELKLGGYCCFWMKLVSLLHKAPILQHLTIGMEDSSCGDCFILGSKVWAELKVPKCFSELRTLCFIGPCYYYSDDDDDDLSCDDTEGKLSCDDEKDELSRGDIKDELSCDYMEDALSSDDMAFVKFVLKYSIVLENMTLSHWGSLNCFKKYELATLKRGSKKCQLKLDEEIL